MKRRRIVLGIVAVLVLSGFRTTTPTQYPTQYIGTLGVAFSWAAKNRCSSTPPAFRISGIPPGTKTLHFKMTDLEVPSYPHGGGNVAYSGSGNIPEGAFFYRGPCPPSGARHNYEFVVTAINAAGDTILARGKAIRAFPPR